MYFCVRFAIITLVYWKLYVSLCFNGLKAHLHNIGPIVPKSLPVKQMELEHRMFVSGDNKEAYRTFLTMVPANSLCVRLAVITL